MRAAQHRYYSNEGLLKSSKRWARDLLKSLHNLAWKQWDHRNNIKPQTLKPGQNECIQRLNRLIRMEYLQGFSELPVGDQLHFHHNILSLLRRPLDYKQAWFCNVTSARRRQARRRANNNEVETLTKEASDILQWIKTGREV